MSSYRLIRQDPSLPTPASHRSTSARAGARWLQQVVRARAMHRCAGGKDLNCKHSSKYSNTPLGKQKTLIAMNIIWCQAVTSAWRHTSRYQHNSLHLPGHSQSPTGILALTSTLPYLKEYNQRYSRYRCVRTRTVAEFRLVNQKTIKTGKINVIDCHWLTCSWIGRVSEVVPKRRGLCECRHRRLVPLGSSRCSQSRCIHHMSLRGTRYAVKQDFDILSNRCSFAIIFKSQTCVLTRTSCKCTKMFRLPETSMYPVYRKSSPNGCRVRGFTLFRSSVWNGHDVSSQHTSGILSYMYMHLLCFRNIH